MDDDKGPVCNVADAPERSHASGAWGATWKVLTPSMRPRGGSLGVKVAHQIANPYDEDLEYLSIGPHDPHEVCGYPDNGKILVRGEQKIGFMQVAEYLAGEPERPRILDLADERARR